MQLCSHFIKHITKGLQDVKKKKKFWWFNSNNEKLLFGQNTGDVVSLQYANDLFQAMLGVLGAMTVTQEDI